jgi:hypothetical protein
MTSQAEASTSATQYGNKILMDINTYSQALQQFELSPYFVFIVGRHVNIESHSASPLSDLQKDLLFARGMGSQTKTWPC